MRHIAFFEPRYNPKTPDNWRLRGGYKYPSLLGGLRGQCRITLVMSDLPPVDDPHRQRLERDFGVTFYLLASLDDAREAMADKYRHDVGKAMDILKPDVVSNLNGRMIGHQYGIAVAAYERGIDHVYRIAGNDLEGRGAVIEADGRPFFGTALFVSTAAQERVTLAASTRVIVMSRREQRRVAAMMADTSNVQICMRGVDQKHFRPAERVPERCSRFLFVGRDSHEKGIDLIRAAAARIAISHPAIRFSFVGEFEPRVEGNCQYFGFHDYADLPGMYQSHHALILAARSEGLPQVLMEAMASALPVVVSKSLFSLELADRKQAMLVDLEVDAIAAAIIALHEDGPLYAAMRTAAYDHAVLHYDEGKNQALYVRALLGDVLVEAAQ